MTTTSVVPQGTAYLLNLTNRPQTLLLSYLKPEGIHVVQFEKTEALLDVLRTSAHPACILFYSDGDKEKENKTLKQIKELTQAPVVVITPALPDYRAVDLFAAGADDVVRSPCSMRELAKRVHALIRRRKMPPLPSRTSAIVDKDMTIDFERRCVYLRGETIYLKPTECRLLYHLYQHAGQMLSYEELLKRVWGIEHQNADSILRFQINSLRKKLKDDAHHPRYISTEQGFGYRFILPEERIK